MDPKFAHLSEDLHVEVATIAPPSEAYGRISYALGQLKHYLTPDSNDDISADQYKQAGMDGRGEFLNLSPNNTTINKTSCCGRA